MDNKFKNKEVYDSNHKEDLLHTKKRQLKLYFNWRFLLKIY